MEAAYEFKICKFGHYFHFKAKAEILVKECQNKQFVDLQMFLMKTSRQAYVAYISVTMHILCMFVYVIYKIPK